MSAGIIITGSSSDPNTTVISGEIVKGRKLHIKSPGSQLVGLPQPDGSIIVSEYQEHPQKQEKPMTTENTQEQPSLLHGLLIAKHQGLRLGPQDLLVDGNVVTVRSGVQIVTRADDALVEAMSFMPRRVYEWSRDIQEWVRAEEKTEAPPPQPVIIDKPGTYLTKDGTEVEILAITKGDEGAEAYGYLIAPAHDHQSFDERHPGSWADDGRCLSIADELTVQHLGIHAVRKKPDRVKLWIIRRPGDLHRPPDLYGTTERPSAKFLSQYHYAPRDDDMDEVVGSIMFETGQWAEPGDEPK